MAGATARSEPIRRSFAQGFNRRFHSMAIATYSRFPTSVAPDHGHRAFCELNRRRCLGGLFQGWEPKTFSTRGPRGMSRARVR